MVELSILRLTETDEWIVPWYEDGKRDEPKTYYTDDFRDAVGTLRANFKWAKDKGYDVSIRSNRYTRSAGLV